MENQSLLHSQPSLENQTLRDAAGLGVLILVIAASQLWGALLGA